MTLELRFLGTGDAFGSGARYQACIWLRVGDFQVLLDCGATSLVAMKRFGVDPNDIDAVLVSHFHGDHFGGLPYLLLDGLFRRRSRDLEIAGPRGIAERLRLHMESTFPGSAGISQRFGVRYTELGSAPTDVGPLAVHAVPVAHTPGADAVGLRIDAGGRSIAYSGDSEWTEALVGLAADSDLFVCEAYSFDRRIPYHLDYRTLAAHLDKLGARRLILTHLGPDMLARLPDVEVEHAEDGAGLLV
jgi:ribonuclease BN (tRNA processing enzyme)